MSRGPSWRLRFIDIDSSFTITTDNSDTMGGMVIRAPKGETEGYYVPKGNTSVIESMFGIGSADWPDISEAIAFNQEFGIWLSAPPGTSADYPSYYGGTYITSNGLFPFYHCSDKTDPGYKIGLAIGAEKDYDDGATPASVSVILSDATNSKGIIQGTIIVSGLSKNIFQKLQNIEFNYWGNGSYAPKGIYTYEVNKTSGDGYVAILYCLNNEGERVKDSSGAEVVCGFVTESVDPSTNVTTYNLLIGKATVGSSATTNGQSTSGVPFINFADMGFAILTKIQAAEDTNGSYAKVAAGSAYDPTITYYVLDGDTYTSTNVDENTFYQQIDSLYIKHVSATNSNTRSSEFMKWIINGTDGSDTYTYNGVTTSLGKAVVGVKARLTSVLSIKDITYMYVVQKSPTEKVTKVTIDAIGYDRYKYDESLTWTTDSSLAYSYTLAAGDKFLYIAKDPNDNISVKVYESQGPYKAAGVTPTQAELDDKAPLDVTADYLTKIIKADGENKATALNEGETRSTYTNTFYYISSKDFGEQQTEDGIYPLKLVNDVNFNTITLSCQEQVYPGKWTVGLSSMQGSLDEEGKSSDGQEIYWLKQLPDDSLSFIEVGVNKTFDGDLTNGCYNKERIAPETAFSVQGQRYITHIVNTNIEEGYNGCDFRDNELITIVKDGWNEFNNAMKYDCCYVLMEPTGYEDLKSTLASLRSAALKLTTIISPKLISKTEFNKPETIAVAGRLTGTAQYVGEFLVKDSYTGKKYWCKPIGDVGKNLCRIIELKLGGWAPMWNNITGGLGGQLDRAVLKAKWDFTDDATKVLDEKGLNPIIYNADDGVMIVSQKTTQDPTNLTDWSYLGHTMAFDLLKREIRDNVMRPQIGKPNDAHWQAIRQAQVEAILDKRITGAQPIWNAATCDIAGVNTDTVKAQRKFAIYVKVKVNVFSEIVELTLENVAQTTVL